MARTYSEKSIKLLFGGARGCAFPGCEAGLIFEDRGELTVVAEIAHIRSERPNGPRYDHRYPPEKLNLPDNLLLLCGIHHKPVDEHASRYSVEELEDWKARQISEGTVRDLSKRQVEKIFQHYELNALGPEGFLKTCQALAGHILGTDIEVGQWPSPRHYDAALDGRAVGYPSPEAPWEGYIILETVYHIRPDEVPRALHYLRDRIEDCFKRRFLDTRRRRPDYVIFATNISLTSAEDRRERVTRLLHALEMHSVGFGLKGFAIWDKSYVVDLVAQYPDIRDAVGTLTASNNLLNSILGRITTTGSTMPSSAHAIGLPDTLRGQSS